MYGVCLGLTTFPRRRRISCVGVKNLRDSDFFKFRLRGSFQFYSQN